jgi:hypothetical protein
MWTFVDWIASPLFRRFWRLGDPHGLIWELYVWVAARSYGEWERARMARDGLWPPRRARE